MRKEISVSRNESGLPGGGAGRKDFVGHSGVYRLSGPLPPGDAPIIPMAAWGQGSRGAAGYEDHGESAIIWHPVTPEKCRDIMTKNPICCLATETATDAARLMKEHNIGVLPVVTNRRGKRIVGVVTDRDLAVKVMASGLDASATIIELALTKPALTCSPDDPCAQALRLMEKFLIKRVVVVDDKDRVVGLISEDDIALRLRDRVRTANLAETLATQRTH